MGEGNNALLCRLHCNLYALATSVMLQARSICNKNTLQKFRGGRCTCLVIKRLMPGNDRDDSFPVHQHNNTLLG